MAASNLAAPTGSSNAEAITSGSARYFWHAIETPRVSPATSSVSAPIAARSSNLASTPPAPPLTVRWLTPGPVSDIAQRLRDERGHPDPEILPGHRLHQDHP